MAGLFNMNLSLPGQNKLRKGTIPVKRTINLVQEPKGNVKPGMAIPVLILGVVSAVAFSKYGIIDRFEKVNEASRRVAAIEAELDAGYEELKDYEDLAELYARYTYSGMSDEELTRTDRVQVLEMMQTVVMPQVVVSSWTLTNRQLTINVMGTTLQQINLIVQSLMEDPLVSYCSVTTANSKETVNGAVRVTDQNSEDTTVTALLIVTLNPKAQVNYS